MHPKLNLVWCDERVHKDFFVALRERVELEAARHGASFTCFKKTPQLARWAKKTNSHGSPFILVTAWREAQPAVAALGEVNVRQRVLGMVVLCDNFAMARRASTWARHPESYEALGVRPVVVEGSSIPQRLFGGLIKDCFGQLGAKELPHASACILSTSPLRVDDVPAPEDVAEPALLEPRHISLPGPEGDDAAMTTVQYVVGPFRWRGDGDALAAPDHDAAPGEPRKVHPTCCEALCEDRCGSDIETSPASTVVPAHYRAGGRAGSSVGDESDAGEL